LSFSIFGFLLTYFDPADARFSAVQSPALQCQQCASRSSFQHCHELCDDYELAAYSGESTLSYFVQMAVLAVQNFASAAAGIAIAIVLIRGFSRQEKKTIGNFWVDVTRATVYVLLPLLIIGGLLFVSQGVIQNLHPYTEVTTVEGAKQIIAQGPVASQKSSSSSGPMAAGFFARTHRIRLRIQRH
jgi:K+-transporting ATPase ATPase A chain